MTMFKNKVYLTSIGLEEIKKELTQLKNIKKPEVSERIQRAGEFGDITENSEYDTAIEEQNLVENRILELEETLKSAQVITQTPKNDFVVIGSTVVIDMEGEVDEFTIVGSVEANPSKKKISNESPVGSALLGAKVGESVVVATPIVRYKCKILEIK